MTEPGLAMECVNCRNVWATMSWDDYLDRAPRWDLISGTNFYLQSFCAICGPIVAKTPEALQQPEGHQLLQDDQGVHCECGKQYSPFRTNLLRGVRVDWESINQERLRHHAQIIEGEAHDG